jgi:type III restriction enzyme
MKLHFEPDLDYQLQAIEAVCDLFRGQAGAPSVFTVQNTAGSMALNLNDQGVGNRLTLLDDELLENLRVVQIRNGLAPDEALRSGDFTVEMETGTGKTYVYLRTIYELNRRYGFTKFVIVVPSVAIKEGVYKSLQITEDHFRALYDGAKCEYFLYDSAKLGQVRNFATSDKIQIMVVTVGAINKKDVNNLYKQTEQVNDDKPIDLIRATRPVVIVDEPQSVDGGLSGAGKRALDEMNPLCVLRYSATHADKHHMVYRLDAVDAYERKLVKQIEVASATVEDAFNRPYVRLISVTSKRGSISAKVQLDVGTASGVQRRDVNVQDGDDLAQTTGRVLYEGLRIGEIRAARADAFIELRTPGGEQYLRAGEAWGAVDTLGVQREMIRRTIKEHFEKEKRLNGQGIKVLSLFFVDEVSRYRIYDDAGSPLKGDYARLFEEEFLRLARHPDYKAMFEGGDLELAARDAHDGYFSIDKTSKRAIDTQEGNEAGRQAAEQAYNLIMRDKERLLSLDTPLRFIFSHSALKEGWDNPNVFQICVMRDMFRERERRQTIGRGLRLCVNQGGQRLRGFDTNTLTVIANENVQTFADNLQKDIEADTGIRFGVVEQHQFANISVKSPDGATEPLGVERSNVLWKHFVEFEYLDAKGKVQDALRVALKSGSVDIPEAFSQERTLIEQVLGKLAGRLEVKNADERRQVRARRAVLDSEGFKSLWDRIKHKTTYRVQFDNGKLISDCIDGLRSAPPIPRTRLQWRKADIAIGKAGVVANETTSSAPVSIEEQDIALPDVLTILQDSTQLTRRSLYRILIESDRLDEFKRNPQAYIELASETINRCKRLALVDGIKYQRLGDEHYYAQELFEQTELTGYLKNMLDTAKKSVFETVVYDSGIEAEFARSLELNEAVKVYAKLPGWFSIATPLGKYNPDWAVLIELDGAERLYFVVETKGSALGEDMRNVERAKIECGQAHFRALGVREAPARYVVTDTLDNLLTRNA